MTGEGPFYKDGIRFECQGEGKCCVTRDRYGYVYLSFNDRRRLAIHLGLTMTAFAARYLPFTFPFGQLEMIENA